MRTGLIAYCIFLAISVYGQSVPQLKEIANQHFALAQYMEAIEFYEKIVRLDKRDLESRYKLAISFYRTLQHNNARQRFSDLVKVEEHEFRNRSFYYLGVILKLQSEFAFADSVFSRLLTQPNADDDLLELARKQREGCQLALNYEEQNRGFTIQEMADLNSRFHDFGAVVNPGEKTVVFVTTRNLGSKQYEGLQYDGLLPDLMQFSRRNNNWRNVSSSNRFDNLNTHWSEGSGTFTDDGNTFYFTSCRSNNGSDCKIMVSRLTDGRWAEPYPLNQYINPDSTENKHPYVTSQGDTLFFASDRPGGFGENDIWMSLRGTEEDSWTPAINLGDVINTSSNEITPYYSSAFNCLLYSSDGHVGYGGYDIFAAKGESFFEPEIYNLGDPFNSSADDTYFNISDSVGFIASNRNDRQHLNLYSFAVSDEKLYLSLLISGESLIDSRIVSRYKDIRTLDLTTFRVEDYQGFELFDPVKRERPKPAILEDTLLEATSDEAPLIASSGEENEENFQQYLLTSGGSGSLLERPISGGVIINEAVLASYVKSDFEKVYFGFGSRELSKQARLSIDHLVNQIKNNVDLVEYIQIVANTDDVGSDQSNLELSEYRGNAVMDYLVSKGFPKERVIVSARGEGNLVSEGTSWYERFFDRRAELFIYSNQPLEFDKSKKLLVRRSMSVANASEILKISPTKIKIWNEMGEDVLTRGDMIRIDEPVYTSNVRYFLDETDVKNKFFPYIVRKGETIAAVARKFRTPEELLVEINQLDSEVSEGDIVFVYNIKN